MGDDQIMQSHPSRKLSVRTACGSIFQENIGKRLANKVSRLPGILVPIVGCRYKNISD